MSEVCQKLCLPDLRFDFMLLHILLNLIQIVDDLIIKSRYFHRIFLYNLSKVGNVPHQLIIELTTVLNRNVVAVVTVRIFLKLLVFDRDRLAFSLLAQLEETFAG